MKRHGFDPFSFLFGALFVAIGVTFLFGSSGPEVARPERLWAAVTIVVGVSLALWAATQAIRKEPSATAGMQAGDIEPDRAGADGADVAAGTAASDEGRGETGSP